MSQNAPIRRQIWEATRTTGGIPDVGRVVRVKLFEIIADGLLLVIGNRKVVAKSATAKDNLLTRTLRFEHGGIRVHLGSTD
jgi:hypothetical protein